MKKKKSKLKLVQEDTQLVISKVNSKIEELGKHSGNLCNSLNNIQAAFDVIRNVPNDKQLEFERLKNIRLDWKQQAEKIDKDYKEATAKNAGAGAAGAGVGVAIVALGPTAAMGVATTFGVASTGTAISTLSGAAATNAALAWLGGGALAAGGGGMVAGKMLLALAGPIGWAIAGVSLLVSGLMFWKAKGDKKRLEDVYTLIGKRDIKTYNLAIVELNERISRISEENNLLETALDRIKDFGTDYNVMTEEQKYELGSYVNLMLSSTNLLVNPIMGLLPKYSDDDFHKYISWEEKTVAADSVSVNRSLIISLSNLLYKIDLDDKDKKLLYKLFKKNKEMLNSLNVKKKEFPSDILNIVEEALNYKYTQTSNEIECPLIRRRILWQKE